LGDASGEKMMDARADKVSLAGGASQLGALSNPQCVSVASQHKFSPAMPMKENNSIFCP
jgi:hypothetical protein